MITSEIALPSEFVSAADEFDRKADDFAALAEEANSSEDCVRYRELEQSWRLRATAERVRQLSQLYRPTAREGVAA